MSTSTVNHNLYSFQKHSEPIKGKNNLKKGKALVGSEMHSYAFEHRDDYESYIENSHNKNKLDVQF